MVEEEQQAYLQNPERQSHELNRAVTSVQRLIRQQVQAGSLTQVNLPQSPSLH